MAKVLPADDAAIAEAVAIIRVGGLVAFPTETVYGLGANALDAGAVAKIFAAKGRPATNPIIVHVADVEQAESLTVDWTPNAAKLTAAFWPGPLTLVLRKADVPDIVTAGGDTVAVRVPDHPVALALLRTSGVPIAAPSANRSTEVSPTTASHVLRSLGDRVPLILDGGPCRGGIESTVVDVTTDVAHVLRPGLISAAMIEDLLGRVEGSAGLESRSPGQMHKHYSPRAVIEVCQDGEEMIARKSHWARRGKIVGLIALKACPIEYAKRIYSMLHEMDADGVDVIAIEMPPDRPEWQAVRDRLTRAARTC